MKLEYTSKHFVKVAAIFTHRKFKNFTWQLSCYTCDSIDAFASKWKHYRVKIYCVA